MANYERINQFHTIYLQICNSISELSRAERMKVGAIIIKDNAIISYGFNGTPNGLDNECEEEMIPYLCQIPQKITKPDVIHAEVNAIYKVACSTTSCSNAVMYSSLEPCFDCARAIIQAEIKCVVYPKYYGTGDGVTLLQRAGVEVIYYAS